MKYTNEELQSLLADTENRLIGLKISLQAIINMVDDHSYSAISALEMVRIFAEEGLAK